jgi:DNA-binding XRE family transcriptional regulator
MKTMILSRGASSDATTDTFLDRESTGSPQSAPAKVIWLNFAVEDELPLPDGFRNLDSVIDEFERDAAGQVAMADARRFVGAELYINQPPRLATFRLAKGWSQKRLAEELGTSQSHVARLETGRSDPQISTVRRICSVLGISIEEFARALEANGKPG